ncbi:MAG: type 1 glutamine amidotransferase [Ancrocorticia sp.]|jgi:protease I|nr:type 1 glutamine amidotransferase [Ancrocorticia sp.]MCI1895970.1 type 1 glutamine amidotransferase [Ancrocorticia sp.]MCI1932466.1 type 1 glutamine amidotransferase [Ancrocorticia sp.]MCI1964154.1 type 1 glutamine amidotransferase [Ancrocorticia sp.]MCI2002591.1 type 1 glutamine amidotransferase [Ancrocorticia sp.]
MAESKRVAFLAKRGVEQAELTDPWAAVKQAGFTPVLVSDSPDDVTALIHDWDRGLVFPVDVEVKDAQADDYVALVLPGGTLNADKIRTNPDAIAFVQAFMAADKPVASICHGPWILIEAGAVKGREITSTTRISTDLKNAGAHWVDQEVVKDGNLISSRSPRDLPAFNTALVAALLSIQPR